MHLFMIGLLLNLSSVIEIYADDVIITDDVIEIIEPVVVADETIIENIIIGEDIISDGEGSERLKMMRCGLLKEE